MQHHHWVKVLVNPSKVQQIVRTINEIIDPEDLLKSIQKISLPEENNASASVTFHKPINQSNQRKSLPSNMLRNVTTTCEEEQIVETNECLQHTNTHPFTTNNYFSKSLDYTSSISTGTSLMEKRSQNNYRNPFNRNTTLDEKYKKPKEQHK